MSLLLMLRLSRKVKIEIKFNFFCNKKIKNKYYASFKFLTF